MTNKIMNCAFQLRKYATGKQVIMQMKRLMSFTLAIKLLTKESWLHAFDDDTIDSNVCTKIWLVYKSMNNHTAKDFKPNDDQLDDDVDAVVTKINVLDDMDYPKGNPTSPNVELGR